MFPNYDAIEAISNINISSQALQQQALPLFSGQDVEKKKEQIEVIRKQAKKLKDNADFILQNLDI
jgi:vacuolar-type H+-ATPase subunit B/Vma2